MILHLNTSREWRGGENQVLNLALGLKSRKIPQVIIAQPKSPLSEKAQQAGIEVIELNMKSEFDFKAIHQIRAIIRERKIGIVHTHTAHAHSIALFAKKKKDKWKLIVSRRVDFRIKKNLFSKWKYKSPKVDLFIGVSRQIQKYLLEDGIEPARVIAIHSGIDIQKFKRLPNADGIRKELEINKKTIVIGIIAALVDHKDHITFLHAISKIETEVPYIAIILGEGKLAPKLKELASKLELNDKVYFLGFKQNIPEYLNLIDIFTLTSKEEGLGTAILDAMAAGKPIVATRGGGIPEMVVHNKGGFLCEVGDSYELALAYKTLIENNSLRKDFSEFNKSYVDRFSFETMVSKTVQVYHSYLGKELFD